ncbi:Sugar kinase of the NBD/HSP70 family, may contain an N-terminal HTH domain [Pseudonocardia thermophila]|uniref:Sugar kinase of the NBD/HSP70 family, may contain an N-terminal HTH domain n=1 Tax=Pseudonocardia thermophila TaxID=1848 RepID=A0A1M6W9Y5_PSETH|nr:ROK family transcriptional regulator [Pseudonocardia thermophila]SHK90582.1 Sugar kinase of the NBD/HSP70 family, may contain an N-terminal HTH domain [Pseudonocardia thermophila]
MIAPAGHRTVRRHNLALVLGCVAEAEPLSRARVAERTGLTRGTVSSLVDELITAGLVTELAAERGGPGRPAAPLQLNRNGPAGLGLELGVDRLGACVVDLTGAVRAQRIVPSEHVDADPEGVLDALAELAAAVRAEAALPIAGAHLAVPGIVGESAIVRLPNLSRWAGVDAAGGLAARLGCATGIANEADLAALAELWFGRTPADFLYASIGIGIGAGVVIGGELFRGPGGRAGELGHMVVEPGGPPCRCGGRGCLERLVDLRDLDRSARALGAALTGAVALLDVRTIVLGGLDPAVAEPLRAAVAAELAELDPPVTVTVSDPGAGGALRGAAATVVRAVIRSPDGGR